MAKEYWFNAYDFSGAEPNSDRPISYGDCFNDQQSCEQESVDWGFMKQLPIYRIHVKMKEPVRYTGNIGNLNSIDGKQIYSRS